MPVADIREPASSGVFVSTGPGPSEGKVGCDVPDADGEGEPDVLPSTTA